MNKKIYVGMIAFGVAASFWACGSGEIITPTDSDKIMRGLANGQDTTDIVYADPYKKVCVDCNATVSSSSSRRVTPKSSSSKRPGSSSSTIVINTSSSAGTGDDNSSSSAPIGPVPVYSSSSSAPVGPGNDAGTCGPKEAVVNRGEEVVWAFDNDATKFSGGLMLKSTFIWKTPGGSKEEATISNYNGKENTVTYATSGQHGATLHIDVTGGSSYDLTCSPVQVNGAPITGCKCTAADKKPDISVGGAWSVTGCTSTGAQIVGYEWVGATATADGKGATQAFTAKNQMAAPVVNVSNDDHSVVAVQCDTVVSVDATSPDYEILEHSNSGAIPIPAGITPVHIKVAVGGQSCVVFCQTTWDAETQGKLNMEVGGVKKSGSFNVTVDLPIDSCDDDMVEFSLSAPATCGVQ